MKLLFGTGNPYYFMAGIYDVSALANEFAKHRASMIEQQLIGSVEALLGRVPGSEEVKSKGMRVLCNADTSLEEFYWEDKFLFGAKTTILRVELYFDEARIKRQC